MKRTRLLITATAIPLFSLIFMATIFGDGKIEDLPIGVVDGSNTSFSQEIIRRADASPVLKIKQEHIFSNRAQAKEAMQMADVTPIVKPIRGGTDGARLSFMGLPCPNIFAGGMNFHGKFEYCSLNTMQKAVKVIVNLAELWAK